MARTSCLFPHGIGGGRANWRAQPGAVGHHIRAAALDLRGYGNSTLGPGQSSADDCCDDILRVAAVLGARRLVLVGLPCGSWIATSFAMRHPDRLDGLVLSGGCTGMSKAGPGECEAFRLSREVPLNAGQVPADFAPAVMPARAVPTCRDALVCFTSPPERFDVSRLTMPVLTMPVLTMPVLMTPVLMMRGADDRLAPPAEIRGVAGRSRDSAHRPDVRFEVIAGAGHICHVEHADAHNDRLCGFLAGLPK